jgi:hypothetical protein
MSKDIFATVNAIAPAVENLACHQEQCDMDGVMVKVSRQALDETLEAVNQIAILSAADRWQPMETAPKNGPIQAYDVYWGVLTAIWFPAKGAERWTLIAYGNEAARDTNFDRFELKDLTHWRPLPTAPITAGQQVKGE